MKKFFASFFGVALLAIAVTAFVSCNTNPNEPNPGGGNDTTTTGPSRAQLIGNWQVMAIEEVIDTCVTDLTDNIRGQYPAIFQGPIIGVTDSIFSMSALDLGCNFETTYEWDGTNLYIQDPHNEKIHYEGTIEKGRLRFMYFGNDACKRYMICKKVD